MKEGPHDYKFVQFRLPDERTTIEEHHHANLDNYNYQF